MAHTSRAQKSSKSSEVDRISALPDDVLHHVLGFLPADEAVHTSLLARRWRYLWKSMRSLRIEDMGRLGESSEPFVNKFVNCLLLLRDPGSTLDELKLHHEHYSEDHHLWMPIWIRHALSCQAQVITVKYGFESYLDLSLDCPPLVSRYLRRLEISDVELPSNFLNFSSCSALKELKIKDCYLNTTRILSHSVKHLSINGCIFRYDGRARISAPNLVSLELTILRGKTPLLESMLSLETAVVRFEKLSGDYCPEGVASGECCGTCPDCCGNDDHKGGCILLEGLSHAKNLELIAYPDTIIFRRDLRWCPTFSKLKTLLLTEWCVQPDLRALVCMLEHSPVLENMTLQLCKQKERTAALEMEESHSLMEKPAAISGYLKIIKVKCEEVDGRVCKVLKFLSMFGIEITIQRTIG